MFSIEVKRLFIAKGLFLLSVSVDLEFTYVTVDQPFEVGRKRHLL